jgi:hypothetical protein
VATRDLMLLLSITYSRSPESLGEYILIIDEINYLPFGHKEVNHFSKSSQNAMKKML